MNFKKLMWKNKKVRAWWITSLSLATLALVCSVVVETVPIISGTFNIIFNGPRPNVAEDYGLYKADYKNKKDVLQAANDFNERVVEEGITLLKNENNVLPLKNSAKITVLGKNSTNLVYGGSGSGGGTGAAASQKNLYDSLEAAGFKTNPVVKNFYENETKDIKRPANPAMGTILSGFEVGEVPSNKYTQKVKDSYKEYNDAAIVVISRIGGEGFDLPRTMKTSFGDDAKPVSGARSADDHYLQLDKNETDLLKEACANFDNVIILLNTPTPLECGFLDDPNHYAYNEKIKGALWMGLPGNSGVMALGRVLNGTVNPSGRLTNTYARDFKKDPSFKNFGNNNITDGNRYIKDGKPISYYYVDYEEGINVGYRYYETRAFEEEKKNPSSSWYKDNVVFPFGYGLSYTDFEWKLSSISHDKITNGSEEIEVKINVKNTGKVAGKDVVQLYYTVPYTKDGIEKSYKVLGDFAKTSLLEPGASEDIVLKLSARDMASYDYNDKNKNDFKGFELEKGTYTLTVAKNVHSKGIEKTLDLSNDIKFTKDAVTDHDIENRFDDVSAGLDQVMSRSDYEGTMPTTPTIEDRTVDKSFTDKLPYKKNDEGKKWFTDKMPTQSSSSISADKIEVTLRDVIGKDFDDPLWDKLMNQLTVEEMSRLIGNGSYGTAAQANIGKPITYESDGPSGFINFMTENGAVYDTCFYAAECVMGATWNKELAKEMGLMIGNESLIGDEKGSGLPYAGWYAPAVNIHRSQFAGRNWEYYSEDGFLSGAIGAEVVKGCAEKGVYTFVKHFAANDQETNRDSNGCLVWLDEQAFREIYLKPFEIIVKEGKTTAIMSSFNRLGTTWAGGSYELLTEILRDEWGFRGMVITDYALARYMNADQMIRAGGDLVLNQGNKIPEASDRSATQITCIRNSCKNILYTIANSNAMNKEIDGYRRPMWEITLIHIDVAIAFALLTWGAIVLIKAKKQDNEVEETNTQE